MIQYKLLGLNKDLNYISIHDFSTDFQKLKVDLESSKAQNEKLKLELNSRGKGKIKDAPKWIFDARTKGTEGLGYNKNNKKKKIYVNLPSSKSLYLLWKNWTHKISMCQKGTT